MEKLNALRKSYRKSLKGSSRPPRQCGDEQRSGEREKLDGKKKLLFAVKKNALRLSDSNFLMEH